MKLSELLAPLLDAKADHETIRSMICAYEAAEENAVERGREKARARWHRWNSKRLQTPANISNPLVRAEDSSSKKDISGKEEKKESAAKPRGDIDAFKAELSPILDAERIDALVAVRRKKGATFSAHAGRCLSKALRAWHDIPAAADEMVLRNWTGFKPEWMEKRSTGPPGKRNYVDVAMDRMRQANGTESIFGNNGDAQRVSPRLIESRPDDADVRGGSG